MSEATKVIVDNQAIGRKGMPRYPEAHGRVLPTNVVPVDAGEPVTLALIQLMFIVLKFRR